MKTIDILSQMKHYLPTNYLFFSVFTVFHFIGPCVVSLITYSTMNNLQNNIYYEFLTFFTFFSKRSFRMQYYHNYQAICYVIYILCVLCLILFIIVLVNPTKTDKESNQITISLRVEVNLHKQRLIPCLSIIITVMAFISSYIIEILSFSLCLIITQNIDQTQLTNEYNENISQFSQGLFTYNTVYLCINMVIIVLLNCFLLFYVKLLNNIHLSNKPIISFSSNNTFLILVVLCQNMQMFHYYQYIFTWESNCIIILNALTLVYLFITIIIATKEISDLSFGNLFIYGALLFCFGGAIISLIFNTTIFIDNNNHQVLLTNLQVFFQLFFQVIFTVFGIMLLCMIKHWYLKRKISQILFRYDRKADINYIIGFIMMMKNCLNDTTKINEVFELILLHQENCLHNECECVNLNVNDLKASIKGCKIDDNHSSNRINKALIGIVLLIENQLMNYMHGYAMQKYLHQSIELAILHCNYVFYFKENYIHSLYIIDEYLLRVPSISIEYKIYLQTFKKKVLKAFNKKFISESKIGSYILKCETFIQYFNRITIIKKHLEDSCVLYAKIFNLKRLLSNCKDKSNTNNDNTNYNELSSFYFKSLFDNCDNLNTIINLLHQNIISLSEANDNKPLTNQEVCYLLTNFFLIVDKAIPNDFENAFTIISSYMNIHNGISNFTEIDYAHPMIIKFKPTKMVNESLVDSKEPNSLYIEYISQQILDSLGYQRTDIINKNINELIPAFLADKQSNLLQRQIFIQKQVEIELLLLLMTKNAYFKRVKNTIGSLPTIKDNILLICNLDFVDKDKDGLDRFRFVVNTQGHIITFTENFASKYQLTSNMINKLQISFCSLFGISIDKMLEQFKYKIKEIEGNRDDSIEKYINVLSSCKLEDFINANSYRKSMNSFVNEEETIKHRFTRERKEFKRMVYIIRKELEEKEVEADWADRLKKLEASLTSENNNCIFTFDILLQNVGNLPYFMVSVSDFEVNMSLSKFPMPTFIEPKARLMASEKYLKKFNVGFMKESQKKPGYRKSSANNESLITAANRKSKLMTNDTNEMFLFNNTNTNQSSTYLGLKDNKKSTQSFKKRISIQNKPSFFRRLFTIEGNPLDSNSINLSIIDGIYYILLKLLSLAIISVYISQIIYQTQRYSLLKNASTLNLNSIIFKQMYYETVNYYSSLCFQSDELEPSEAFGLTSTMEDIKKHLYKSSDSMFKSLNILLNEVKTLHDYKESETLFNLLYDSIELKRLLTNWNIETYQSAIEYEISLDHYHMGIIRKGTFEKCRVKEYFLNNPDLLFNTENIALVEERRLADFLLKTINVISKRIDLFIVGATGLQRNIRLTITSDLILMNIVFIALLVGEMIIFALSIYSFQKKIEALLLLFVRNNGQINIVELKIGLLLSLMKSFDESICEKLETAQSTPNDLLIPSIKTVEQNTSSLTNKASISNKEFKKTKKSPSHKPKKQIATDEDDNPNESNHSKMSIRIRLITINYLITFIFFAIFIITAITSMTKDLNNLNDLKLTNEIGKIYMSSIPRLSQILLYYKFSILLNNPLYGQLDPEDYKLYDYSYSEFFLSETTSINDTRYLRLGHSTIAFYFKKFFEEIEVMKKYNQNKNLKVLPQSRTFQNDISCIEMVKSFTSSSSAGIADKILDETIANGIMNKGGLQINLENSVNSIFNIYLDFADKTNTDETLIAFLLNDDYILAIYQLENIFVYMFYTLSQLITSDMTNFFMTLNYYATLFAILLSIEIIIITSSFIFVLYPKMEVFFSNFKAIACRIEISLMEDTLNQTCE